MFGIGVPELAVIVILAIIFIGPQRLPGVARTVGKGYREFRGALDGVKEEFTKVEDSVKNGIDSVGKEDK